MKILIADALTLVRSGLRQCMEVLSPDLHVIEAHDLASLEQSVGQHPDADLVIADAALPGTAELATLCQVLARAQGRAVLLLPENDAATAIVALNAGVAGVVGKSAAPAVLLAALRLVLAGGTYISPEMFLRPGRNRDCVSCAVTALAESASPGQVLAELTVRQCEVMRLMLEGHSNKEIAARLGLTEGTVKVHVTRILRALNVSSRAKAVAMARRAGQRP